MAILFVGLTACVTNPATGERRLNFISMEQEIEMGSEADTQIGQSMGFYPDDNLQAYVSGIATTMAATTEWPDLPWTFRVVDNDTVNAFALPGGYVYVTRAILAHFNNEAQLAGVLAHEIGHVTARHGATRLTRMQMTQLGMGYDPEALISVMDTLRRVSEARGEGRLPQWLATHPHPENRQENIRGHAAALDPQDYRSDARDEYLKRVDGIVYGPDPREGYVLDGEGVSRTRINGLPAGVGSFAVRTEQGPIEGSAAFIEYDGRVYQLIGYSSASTWETYRRPVTTSIESFQMLSDRDAIDVEPMRLETMVKMVHGSLPR